MSGPGRPPLQTRARQPRPRTLRARRHQSRSAGARLLGETAKNDRRKGRKGREPRILRKWGPFRRWREAAETGGNWRKPPAETLLKKPSAVLLSHFWGPCQSPDWRNACGNCGNSLQKPFAKPTALCVSLSGCPPGFAGGASATIRMMEARK
jgi:hypothetical protein